MRISDWSSDVCSSDLDGYQGVIDRNIIPLLGRKKVHDVKRPDIAGLMEKLAYKPTEANKTFGVLRKMFNLDRKSVVEGKSVSVRVDLGGSRIIKKKTKEIKEYNNIMHEKEHND